MRLIRVGILFASLCASLAQAEAPETITKELVDRFYIAWNANDLEGMKELLSPHAFFKSPYQLRYGRDEMLKTVLITNPPAIREVETVEWHSHVDDQIAWSIGQMDTWLYDKSGQRTGERGHSEYTHIFRKDAQGEWKLEVMLFHE